MTVITCSSKTQYLIQDINLKNSRMLEILDTNEFLIERIKYYKKNKKKSFKNIIRINSFIDFFIGRIGIINNINNDKEIEDLNNVKEIEDLNNKINKLRMQISNLDREIYISCKSINIFSSILDNNKKEYKKLLTNE